MYGGGYVNYCSFWYKAGHFTGESAAYTLIGAGIGTGIKAIQAARAGAAIAASSKALQPLFTLSQHAIKRMAQRDITRRMIEVAIIKGKKYYESAGNVVAHIPEGGMASGESLFVLQNPATKKIITTYTMNAAELASKLKNYIPLF